jgi:4-amino-4-deoxy-L-arabinose transferase-like glycosyltransferase
LPARVSRTHVGFLWLVLLSALVLRIGSLLFFQGSIDWEGAEYARLAENLRAGAGYVGIDLPGKNLMFPPLYPYLIAGVSLIVPNFEMAARLISIVLGAALVVPVYFLARQLYDDRVGRIAAIVVAVHPLLVHFSATAASETTFLFFVIYALSETVGAMRAPQTRRFVAAGILLALAYLTRIEGAPLLVIALCVLLAVAVLRYRRQHTSAGALLRDVGRILCMPAAFVVLSAPYIFWLHQETGQWRLEGKAPLNIETAKRVVLGGEDATKVHVEVDADLNERGIWIRPYMDTIRSSRLEPDVLVRYVVAKAQTTIPWLAKIILGINANGIAFGTPLFAGLALLGAFAFPRRKEMIAGHVLLLGYFALTCFQTLLIFFQNLRFLVVMVPVMAVWAAAGVACLHAWIRADDSPLHRAATRIGVALPATRRVELALLGGLSVVLLVTHVAALRRPPLQTFNAESRPIKYAAQALATGTHAKRPILVGQNTIAYHANADYCPFPYTDSATALRYFDKRKVSYIALSKSELKWIPYLPSWWENGIPSSSAVLIGSVTTTSGEEVRFYKWSARSG